MKKFYKRIFALVLVLGCFIPTNKLWGCHKSQMTGMYEIYLECEEYKAKGYCKVRPLPKEDSDSTESDIQDQVPKK